MFQKNARTGRVSRSMLGKAMHFSIAAALLGVAQSSSAATKTWLDTDGLFWSNAAGWTPAVVPVNGDDVVIGNHSSATTSPTLNFTSNLTAINLNSLKIDSTGVGGTMFFSQTLSTSVMNATTETIGDTIGGNVYTQNAGANNASTITMGNTASGVGTYTLSGSGTVTAGNFTVGNSGTGIVNQSGGTVTVNLTLNIGIQSTGSGAYALSGSGILNASNEYFSINGGSAGNFNQTGGTNTITNNGNLILGQNGAANYALSNGTLNVIGAGA